MGDAVGVSIGAVVARIVEIGDGGKFVSDLPCGGDAVEVALIVIVVRRLRTDGSGRKNRQLAIQKVESDAAVKSDAIVVIVDTGVNAPRNSGVNIKPFGRMKGRQAAGVVKRDPHIKNVGMGVEEIRAWIDGFRSFQGDEFAKLQVDTALADNGKVKAEISFDEVRLDDRGARRVAEQTK